MNAYGSVSRVSESIYKLLRYMNWWESKDTKDDTKDTKDDTKDTKDDTKDTKDDTKDTKDNTEPMT
jgi:hypothetical protein